MGANDLDHGGFGICVSDVSDGELDSLRKNSEHVDLSIARANGDLSGLKAPSKPIVPTIPFSLIPARLFLQERWLPAQAGRWRAADHVNLGELRAVV